MSKRLKRSLQQQRGMTLVEVVVVIAVAGILAAATAPSVFGAIQRERRRQVANDVANFFREARNQAMSRAEAYVVWIDGQELKVGRARGGTGAQLLRSCRQIALDNGANSPDVIKTYNMSHRASANMKIHARSSVAANYLCFEPDGSISDVFFGSVSPPASPDSCEGERFVMYLADADIDIGLVNANMNCSNKASDYEVVGGHVVRVFSNGEVGLRTPSNG